MTLEEAEHIAKEKRELYRELTPDSGSWGMYGFLLPPTIVAILLGAPFKDVTNILVTVFCWIVIIIVYKSKKKKAYELTYGKSDYKDAMEVMSEADYLD